MSNDPKKDGEAIDKLVRSKELNRAEQRVRRAQGNDSKHTRDGGTNRRVWR